MGRTETPTKLSISEWARIMGINPLHFEGVGLEELTAREGNCSAVWFQHEWQGFGSVSRDEIARLIARAEADIEEALGYRLLPTWEVDERQVTTRPIQPETVNLGTSDVRWMRQTIITAQKWFITPGIRATTLIGTPAISWIDPDPVIVDYSRNGSVAIATSVTDACEIRIYYPGTNADPRYEIRPAQVAIAGGIATITFARELTVLEALQEQLIAEPIAGEDDANFLATVDVYRVYNDPSTQVSFLWEPTGGCGCLGSGGSCPSCSYATSTGCLVARDERLGIVGYAPASWDTDSGAFVTASLAYPRQPDILRLYYLAGLQTEDPRACPRVTMDQDWARTVAYYAASMVDREWCSCIANMAEKWQEDLAFANGAEELSQYRLSPQHLKNPFGTRRGAVYAWNRVNGRDQRVGRMAVGYSR